MKPILHQIADYRIMKMMERINQTPTKERSMNKTLSINITADRKAPEPKIRQIFVHDLSAVRVEIPVKRKKSKPMEAALKAVAGIQ